MSGVMKKDLANKFVLVSFSCQLDRAESLQRRESNKGLSSSCSLGLSVRDCVDCLLMKENGAHCG